jgi:hypothetical protein
VTIPLQISIVDDIFLINLDIGGFDHRGPSFDYFFNQFPEFFWGTANYIEPHRIETGFYRRLFQDGPDFS